MRILIAAATYFGLVFACAFALGTLRVLLLEPAVGVTAAELMELPLLVVISALIARWSVRRHRLLGRPRAALAVGLLALAATVLVELFVVLRLRGLDLDGYLAERDAIALTAYLATLAIFGLFPWWFARRG